MNNYKIDKKVVLLFGAAGGMGKEIVKLFESKENLDSFELIKFDRENVDLNNLQNIKDILIKTFRDYKLENSKELIINSVIYCAGIILQTEVENSPTLENLQDSFAINTFATILIHNFLQDKLSEDAKFIYISSTATLSLNGLFPLYTTTKKATETFLRIQSEKVKRNENNFQKIICILPGPTNTPMREKIAKDASTKQSPEVIANTIGEIIIKNKYENRDKIILNDNTTSLVPPHNN